MTQHDGYAAHFNADASGVIIEHLDISATESRHPGWRSSRPVREAPLWAIAGILHDENKPDRPGNRGTLGG